MFGTDKKLVIFDSLVEQLRYDLAQQQQSILVSQLNDLVSRNLLIVENTEPVFIREEYNGSIRLEQGIKLTLKDKEYILQLEKENKELREALGRSANK